MVRHDLEIIDSDGHIMEPADLWGGEYMSAAYRDRGPVISLSDGRLSYPGGEDFPCPTSFSKSGSLGWQSTTEDAPRFGDGRKGAWEPHGRIEDMDLDGIDVAAVFPTVGLAMPYVKDVGLAAAMARAYNTWLRDWTHPYPDRLIGVAMLPVQSVAHAVEELRFARNELGFKAAFLRPHVYEGRTIHSRDWDPFWAEAQELDCPIALHGGSAWPTPQAGADRFARNEGKAAHVVIHPFEQQLAFVGLITTGVFERFPGLRVAFLESGGGWVVPLLERLERHYDQHLDSWEDAKTSARPQEYFERNCWISFEPIEKSLGLLADHIGPTKILWATDYPHPDGFFPGAPKMIEECLAGCSQETRRGVLGGGARAFYGL